MAARPHTGFWRETRSITLLFCLHMWVACCQNLSQLLPTDNERNIVSESSRQTSTDESIVSERIPMKAELRIGSEETTAADMLGNEDHQTTQPPSFLHKSKDDAIKSQRTKEFLTSIPDLEIRTLTEKYLRLCPMSPLCNYTLDYSDKPPGASCCVPCNCTASCKVGEDCCPHLLSELGPSVSAAEHRYRCIDPVVLRRMSFPVDRHGYHMETTCSGFMGDSRLAHRCSTPYEKRVESLKVSDVVPVTDLTSNTTYLNIHCARCAGLQPDSVSFWQPEIHCSDGPLLLSSEASVMAAIRARYDCYLKNLPGANIQAHLSYCIASFRETCNETGLWQQYDQFTERTCAALMTNYTIETVDGYIVYRNVFCAVCNGETIAEACSVPTIPISTTDIVPFSALLQFSLHEVENAESPSSFNWRDSPNQDEDTDGCEINSIYDTHKNICRPLICPAFHRLQNGSCVDQFMTLEGVNYEVLLKLVPNISMPTEVALDAINAIKTDIDVSQCNVPDVYIKVDYPFQGDTFTTLVDIRRYNSSISHFIARLRVQQGPNGVENVEDYVKENLTGTYLVIEVHKNVFELYVEVMWADSWYFPYSYSPPEYKPTYQHDPSDPFPHETQKGALTLLPSSKPLDNMFSFHDFADDSATDSTPLSTTDSTSDTNSSVHLTLNNDARESTPSSPRHLPDTPPTSGLPLPPINRPRERSGVSPWDSIVSAVDPHDHRVILTLASRQPIVNALNLRCVSDNNRIKFNEQLDCPMVKLTTSDYTFEFVPDGIVVQDINVSLSFQDFYSSDQHAIFVCEKKIYTASKPGKHHHAIPMETTSGHVFAETIVSLICTCCSILCLLVTLTIYCMFPTLRTVPGRNNMMLMATLILAQTLYIVMSVGGIRVDWLCETVGLLLHFFWLSAIFWMGICSFHMFSVFSRIAKQNTEDDKCTFYVYIVIVNIAAVLIVVSNSVAAQVTTDGRRIGYGGLLCYISSGKMILFTFGIPVAVVIVTNLVMFVLVVVKIKSLPNVQKNVKRERNTAIILAKLSTLTGVTWIFGFLAQWTGLVAFTYIFAILNASQGVFLMFSFVCNKRIFNMMRKWYRDKRKSSTAFL